MCEIQFIKKFNGNLNDNDIIEFEKMLKYGSINNRDAFGLFNNKVMFKKKGLIDFQGFDLSELKKSNFVIGHNRLSTGGSADINHNNQPFKLNNLLLCHNGIIDNESELDIRYNLKTSKIETDSYIVLRLIDHFLKKKSFKHKKAKRVNLIADSINKTARLLEGSYSIFVYDILTNSIFYFKNSKTDFYFVNIDDSILLGTTSLTKIKYIYEKSKYKEVKLKDCNVYLIENCKKLKFMSHFKEKKTVYRTSYSNYGYDNWGYSKEYNPINKDNKNIDKVDIIDGIFMDYLNYVPEYFYSETTNNIIISEEKSDVFVVFENVCKMSDRKIIINYNDLINKYGF